MLRRDTHASGRSIHHGEALPLATATLLVEIARADHQIDQRERDTIETLLHEQFALSSKLCRELIAHAEQESEHSVSLYPYTRLINDHFDIDEKQQIIEQLWRVAYADGHKDDHEEHLIRKIASLIYLPHRSFVAARQRTLRTSKRS